MALQQITSRTFYFPGANNLGVVATESGGAIAIDTGLDKDVARKFRKALDEAGLTLRAIINTHHHADHIGGNAYLVRNVPGVQVYAPPIEAALIEYPILEPVYLHYGASPFHALRTRWLMAQGVRVQHIVGDVESIAQGRSQTLEVEGITFEVLALSGHSIAQIGLSFDGVCFAADSFFGIDIVAKHGILLAHDVAAQLASFERLLTREETWFLPGHGDLSSCAEITGVVEANRTATLQASAMVLQALDEPGDLAAVTARVLQRMGRAEVAIPQYAVFASAVAGHLSFLEQQGQVQVDMVERGLTWRAKTS